MRTISGSTKFEVDACCATLESDARIATGSANSKSKPKVIPREAFMRSLQRAELGPGYVTQFERLRFELLNS